MSKVSEQIEANYIDELIKHLDLEIDLALDELLGEGGGFISEERIEYCLKVSTLIVNLQKINDR